MCMSDDYSINFLGLDVHWENGLTLEQDAIVHHSTFVSSQLTSAERPLFAAPKTLTFNLLLL